MRCSQPFTPSSQSELVCPPPWHYSVDVIASEFKTHLGNAQCLMPEGFVATGTGLMMFADWCSAADADKRLIENPCVGQYKEALIALHAVPELMPRTKSIDVFEDFDDFLHAEYFLGDFY